MNYQDQFTLNKLNELEDSLQYIFNDETLLIEALSHPSLKQQKHYKQNDYQRLEFLGDAILGFVISEMIYNKYPHEEEGNLAKIKSYLVCKDTICSIAQKIGIAKYLIMTEGEEISGGRNNPNNIENAMEALIAALYLDGGILQVKTIIQNLWQASLNQKFDATINDPKTTLQEWSQKGGTHEKPIYRVILQKGLAHAPIFTVEVTACNMKHTAQGQTVKAAEKGAASGLLAQLKRENLL